MLDYGYLKQKADSFVSPRALFEKRHPYQSSESPRATQTPVQGLGHELEEFRRRQTCVVQLDCVLVSDQLLSSFLSDPSALLSIPFECEVVTIWARTSSMLSPIAW